MIADAQERLMARDPQRSVIVQAPAGSGKTELLMQRYLALLALVDDPEQILAVTFTRKAAAEMRHRVLNALRPEQGERLLPETAQLAEQVLLRDQEQGWQLLDYPARLRICTFDAVNSWLSDSAPLSDGDGSAQGVVTERRGELYELAARQVLELVTEHDDLGGQLSVILRHLDNRADRFVGLMAQMLLRRDQWLPLIGRGEFGADVRAMLEVSLRELVERALVVAADLLGPESCKELSELLPFSAKHLVASKPDAAVCVWRERTSFPAASPDELDCWRGIAEFALVKSNKDGPAFRKTVNKSSGFPVPKDGGDKAITERAKALLESFAGNTALAAALDRLRAMPEPEYSDTQWEALEALIAVLPVVAAQLDVVFREHGETDYTQIASQALKALGDEEAPTGLALRLDYQVQHILIDEFQDTSRTQYKLLSRLTAGWTGDDGRSLMVVGDPMQSIYRFRQADVGLFIRLREEGIGDLLLEPITLATNFRSDPAVVSWVNNTFAELMPEDNDPATGAVRFAQGSAHKKSLPNCGVTLHKYEAPARVDEAGEIAEIVSGVLAAADSDTIGILVRTRHQARLIAPQLRARGIVFAGEGLEQPGETSVEQDLLALTRALSHEGDRTAWLAILRAPWCGLSLVDIEALCGKDWRRSVREQMADSGLRASLSADGQRRVEYCSVRIEEILARQAKLPLRDWIEGAWQQLGGPASLHEVRDLELAGQFFELLGEYDAGGNIASAFQLHEHLADRIDRRRDSEVRVHLLTLFKAKGLEYDTVILPVLDGTTRQDDKQVVAWHEYEGWEGDTRYLMAPIEATGDDSDPIQKLIRQFDREQAGNERDRLLYVATTRAKKNLHLFVELKRNSNGDIATPRKGSLLERLWPVVESDCNVFRGVIGTPETSDKWFQPKIRRFDTAWVPPEPPPVLVFARNSTTDREPREVTFDWAGSDAMRIGSVVHRCLQFIVEQGDPAWSDAEAIIRMLREAGVEAAALDASRKKVLSALQTTAASKDGQWALSAHLESACEYPVTVCHNGQTERLIIDRMFVATDGVRWIVDYKTSSHEGGGLDGFLANELERYAGQLLGYCNAMQSLEPDREVRAGLYFPLLGIFSALER